MGGGLEDLDEPMARLNLSAVAHAVAPPAMGPPPPPLSFASAQPPAAQPPVLAPVVAVAPAAAAPAAAASVPGPDPGLAPAPVHSLLFSHVIADRRETGPPVDAGLANLVLDYYKRACLAPTALELNKVYEVRLRPDNVAALVKTEINSEIWMGLNVNV